MQFCSQGAHGTGQRMLFQNPERGPRKLFMYVWPVYITRPQPHRPGNGSGFLRTIKTCDEGVGSGREVQEGEHICVHIVDLL